MRPMTAVPPGAPSKFWSPVEPGRSPWVPGQVQRLLDVWWREIESAPAIVAAGERVLPLLLVGESRCGKTSAALKLAASASLPVRRLSLSGTVGSFMGETAGLLTKALAEIGSGGVWLIDEIDGIAMPRQRNDKADSERTLALTTFLSLLDDLQPDVPLIATTNMAPGIDPAIIGRFIVVEWPAWASLSPDDRAAFVTSHGGDVAGGDLSYADAVRRARSYRVARVLEAAHEKPRRKRSKMPALKRPAAEAPQ